MKTNRMNIRKKAAFGLLVLPLLLVGCGGAQQTATQNTPAPATTSQTTPYNPVTITTGGTTVTFKEAPKRAVSLNQHTTEMMLALGLEDRMVGTAYLDDEILPEYAAKYAKIPVLADQYPSLEVLLGANPDFVFGRKSAFSDKALGSVQSLAQKGINAYVVKGTEVSGTTETMEDVYTDFQNLGNIFNIQDRSTHLIEQMKQDIAAVHQKVANVQNPVRVAVYDSGDTALYTSGKSLETHLIELAGGKNVFDDVEKSWAEVSWEELVKRNPDVIVINDYDTPTAQEKIDALVKNPALQSVTAIKNKRFVALPLSDAFEGIRNVRAVQTLAKGFYPETFK